MARRTLVVGIFAGVVGLTTVALLIVSGAVPSPGGSTPDDDVQSAADRAAWPPDVTGADGQSPAAAGGYSGTERVRSGRRRRARRTETSTRPDPGDWRTRQFITDDAVDTFATRLGQPWRYPELLRRLYRVGGSPELEFDDGTDRWFTETRFQREPERMARLLIAAIDGAKHPIARQALIFHTAIAFPAARAEQLLAPYLEGDPADAEDALCALAFTGSETAVARFEELACAPSRENVRRDIDWDGAMIKIERAQERGLLRSYRCIEALDRSPYFHIHGLWYDGVRNPFPWAARRSTSVEQSERLLMAWLRRYPGHNGSDDMAYRLAFIHYDAGRGVEALRWATRCSAYPDNDMRYAGVALTKALVEFAPGGADAARVLLVSGEDVHERELVAYMLIRRAAHDFGYEAGLRAASDYALSERETRLAQAFRERWAAPVPRALGSGTTPLGRSDPLRRLDARPVARTSAPERTAPRSTRGGPLRIAAAKLRGQFRAWETLAELERRAAVAPADEAVELLYKQGAVHYHDRDVLYPVYANHDANYSGRPSAYVLDLDEPPDRPTWLGRVSSWDLAVGLWTELLARDAAHPVADRALYSIGLAQVKAVDDRALAWTWWQDGRKGRVVAAVDAFDRLVSAHPGSPLRPSAAAAARYWRKTHADLF